MDFFITLFKFIGELIELVFVLFVELGIPIILYGGGFFLAIWLLICIGSWLVQLISPKPKTPEPEPTDPQLAESVRQRCAKAATLLADDVRLRKY